MTTNSVDAATAASVTAPASDSTARWRRLTDLTLDRAPAPYGVMAFLLGAVVLAEQIMEQSLLSPIDRFFAPDNLRLGLALPALTIYMLLAHKILKRSALPQLAQLRPAVLVDDTAYDTAVQRIVQTSPRAEAALLLAALAITTGWFVMLRLPYPMMAAIPVHLPANLAQALLTLAAYTIFGWAGLALVWSTWRFGRGLGQLARQPLAINSLDPDDVLPFGRLSLRQSLTVAVTVLLFVIPLGAPGDLLEYGVLALASLASLSALIFPLLGVHGQMQQARDRITARISQELAGCQSRLMTCSEVSNEVLSELSDRTEKLIGLRSTVYRSPTWPFRNASSVVRVLLAALSPLLYFVLNEILRTYVLPMLGIG
ncbi:MAG TPA: hypothetical protein VL334_23075 [Anaerolineae bacterium]|nr:hypothetical protein [Anaerolineae bacterium]